MLTGLVMAAQQLFWIHSAKVPWVTPQVVQTRQGVLCGPWDSGSSAIGLLPHQPGAYLCASQGGHMMKMVACKSVVSGHREDPVAMVDSDLSESTGHYGEEKHADPSDDTEG
jgi:hypothetical protein